MFGYVRVQKSELLVREYEAYKAVYCGLCKQMGRDYSFLSRLLLSYDCTFYAIFVMSLQRSCTGFENGRCRFNPLKKCSFSKCKSDALSKAAALSILLSYRKLLDNIGDSKGFKRLFYKILSPLLRRWQKKAKKRYPELDRLSEQMLNAQFEAEKDENCHLDLAADPTATLLSKVLELEARNENEKPILARVGYGLGRFIYLIDAADDFEKDKKSGNFNPFLAYENPLEIMKNNLSSSLGISFEAYDKLELVDFKGIIDNVILKGLPTVQNEVLDKLGNKE